MIGARRFGNGPPLVALHGFTLTGEQFASAGSFLGHTVIAPDLPGHGRNVDARTHLTDVIEFVASTVDFLGQPVPVIGYSQGGRLALATALDRPDRMSALVLISAGPGIEDAGEREVRARSDARLAARLATSSIDEFLDTWTSTGITSTEHLSLADRDADRVIRHQNSPHGLARAVVGYGQGTQPSMWHLLHNLTMPVLVISGGRDEKYSHIADAMANKIADVKRLTIDDAGHNPLLDAPEQAYAAISDFIDRRG